MRSARRRASPGRGPRRRSPLPRAPRARRGAVPPRARCRPTAPRAGRQSLPERGARPSPSARCWPRRRRARASRVLDEDVADAVSRGLAGVDCILERLVDVLPADHDHRVYAVVLEETRARCARSLSPGRHGISKETRLRNLDRETAAPRPRSRLHERADPISALFPDHTRRACTGYVLSPRFLEAEILLRSGLYSAS